MNPQAMQQLRAAIGRNITGDASFDGSAGAISGLSDSERIALVNAVKAYIRANPSQFNDTQRAIAATGDIASPESYGFADAAAEFFDEVGNQAARINSELNPFAAGNTRTLFWVLVGAAVVYFVAPSVIRSLKEKPTA